MNVVFNKRSEIQCPPHPRYIFMYKRAKTKQSTFSIFNLYLERKSFQTNTMRFAFIIYISIGHIYWLKIFEQDLYLHVWKTLLHDDISFTKIWQELYKTERTDARYFHILSQQWVKTSNQKPHWEAQVPGKEGCLFGSYIPKFHIQK